MLTLSVRYGLYIYLIRSVDWTRLRVWGIGVGSRRLAPLINTCSRLTLTCQPDTVFFGIKKKKKKKKKRRSLNHRPTLNCSPNVQTYETLNKAPFDDKSGARGESRNVQSVAGFEGRTCSPLVSVCGTSESTAAAKRKQELITGGPPRTLASRS